jgi:hypothetical protein
MGGDAFSRRTLADYATLSSFTPPSRPTRAKPVLTRALDIASVVTPATAPHTSSSLTGCPRAAENSRMAARATDYGFAPLGITSAADSLHAIQRAV